MVITTQIGDTTIVVDSRTQMVGIFAFDGVVTATINQFLEAVEKETAKRSVLSTAGELKK
jgi:hypothetical protein